jgi:acetoacetyl-CoA synthetase
MPVSLWNDPDGARLREAYFDLYPGTWRHGDRMTTTRFDTYLVHGRSNSTMNLAGERMSSADLYAVVDKVTGVAGSLVIDAVLQDGGYFMPLFVELSPGPNLIGDLVDRINDDIRARLSPRHIPDEVIAVPEIPMTVAGEKLEIPIKRLLQGEPVERAVEWATVANPQALDWFLDFVRERSVRRSSAEVGRA